MLRSPSRILWQVLFTKLNIVPVDHKGTGTPLEFSLSVMIKFNLLNILFVQYLIGIALW